MPASVPAPLNEPPVRNLDELAELFRAAEKPPTQFRVGVEAEKFAVTQEGRPLGYDGEPSVVAVFEALTELGWEPERETVDGPVVALRRGAASITLEPGSQLELSGSALPNLHEANAELQNHFRELQPVSRRLGLTWLGVGFHPLARQDEFGWVPKQRYPIMREYLPQKGPAAHDMMRRTATVQANFDFSSESDALTKLVLSLKLSPLVHAMLANSPFKEGRVSASKSLRGEVWLHMDPSRSGLITALWTKKRPGYLDYVEWALDAGMFLFKRDGKVIANTGQTFRSFLADGFEGQRATVTDFKLHLQTLFPEARLKNTLEVRGCDSLSAQLSMAVPALFTGLLYDAKALDAAQALAEPFTPAAVEQSRLALVREGLAVPLAGKPAIEWAQALFEIAEAGLKRRNRRSARNEDEACYLAGLRQLLEHGQAPADALLHGLTPGQQLDASELISRCKL